MWAMLPQTIGLFLLAIIIPLEPVSNLDLRYVKAETVVYKGKKAVRLSDAGADNLPEGSQLAVVKGTEFQDGVIEVDLAGDTLPGKGPQFRGFTGIAFRVSQDASKYEAFYLRPKNGRSEDQLQRNHSAQYMSKPDFGWERLRNEFPGVYESYVDLEAGAWTKIKIDVRGDRAKLYVNGADQPTLIVNGLKRGVSKGSVALWIGPGTQAHCANLRITAAK
jgi:hypothetical protein